MVLIFPDASHVQEKSRKSERLVLKLPSQHSPRCGTGVRGQSIVEQILECPARLAWGDYSPVPVEPNSESRQTLPQLTIDGSPSAVTHRNR